jgi:predicted metal-dependent hydrolase
MAMREKSRIEVRTRVSEWALRRVAPRVIRVQRMTPKWGSCTTSGIVTLAENLAAQDKGFQDFVTVHELLHLRIKNHGKVFKAFMSLHVLRWRRSERTRRRAYRRTLTYGNDRGYRKRRQLDQRQIGRVVNFSALY